MKTPVSNAGAFKRTVESVGERRKLKRIGAGLWSILKEELKKNGRLIGV